MEYKVISCKTALSPSKLSGIDYALNPYRGCSNGCLYCYAPYVLRAAPEKWSEKIEVKLNMPEVLNREIRRVKGIIGIGTVTDPYQDGEKRYLVTRKCLQVISSLSSPPPVTIQTKCSLVKRDLDLLQQLKGVNVGFTITSLDDSLAYEPHSSSNRERIECARELKRAGIEIWAFIGPVLPGITDLDIEGLIDELSDFPQIFVDRFRPKPGMLERIEHALVEKGEDELAEKLASSLRDRGYFPRVMKRIEEACDSREIRCEGGF